MTPETLPPAIRDDGPGPGFRLDTEGALGQARVDGKSDGRRGFVRRAGFECDPGKRLAEAAAGMGKIGGAFEGDLAGKVDGCRTWSWRAESRFG